MKYHLICPSGSGAFGRFNEAAAWATARAILEQAEPGSSGHCLRRLDNGWHHHRLDITVTLKEAP